LASYSNFYRRTMIGAVIFLVRFPIETGQPWAEDGRCLCFFWCGVFMGCASRCLSPPLGRCFASIGAFVSTLDPYFSIGVVLPFSKAGSSLVAPSFRVPNLSGTADKSIVVVQLDMFCLFCPLGAFPLFTSPFSDTPHFTRIKRSSFFLFSFPLPKDSSFFSNPLLLIGFLWLVTVLMEIFQPFNPVPLFSYLQIFQACPGERSVYFLRQFSLP